MMDGIEIFRIFYSRPALTEEQPNIHFVHDPENINMLPKIWLYWLEKRFRTFYNAGIKSKLISSLQRIPSPSN